MNVDDFSIGEARDWADVTVARLVACYYDNSSELWNNEAPWQSGNTLESVANFVSLMDSPERYIFQEIFERTRIFVPTRCYDDYQS
jgi:hypothetical protein